MNEEVERTLNSTGLIRYFHEERRAKGENPFLEVRAEECSAALSLALGKKNGALDGD